MKGGEQRGRQPIRLGSGSKLCIPINLFDLQKRSSASPPSRSLVALLAHCEARTTPVDAADHRTRRRTFPEPLGAPLAFGPRTTPTRALAGSRPRFFAASSG
jgi:hypothetical protein